MWANSIAADFPLARECIVTRVPGGRNARTWRDRVESQIARQPPSLILTALVLKNAPRFRSLACRPLLSALAFFSALLLALQIITHSSQKSVVSVKLASKRRKKIVAWFPADVL